jgi:prepilin-type N-terminal cleavage/methylation domain-containing protein
MRHQARKGFTLIEMLVSVALVLFIMVLLSQAFAAGLEVFRQLKGIADMEHRLRATSIILRQDLSSPHFEASRTLNDPQFWSIGPPQSGFFRIFQGSHNAAPADADGIPARVSSDHVLHFSVRRSGNTFGSFFVADVSSDPAAWNVNPTTSTPIMPLYADWTWGGSPPAASRYQLSPASPGPGTVAGPPYLPPFTYTSQWAEIAYFLRANGANANGTTLYSLYRRQRLAFPGDNTRINTHTPTPYSPTPDPPYTTPVGHLTASTTCLAYTDISCMPNPLGGGTIYFNNPEDLTVPQRRFNMDQILDGGVPHPADQPVPSPALSNYYSILSDPVLIGGVKTYIYAPLAGSDILLTDVISFDVQVYYQNQPVPNDFNDLPASTTNPLFAGSGAPGSYGWCFDTWSSNNDVAFPNYKNWQTTGNSYSVPNQLVIQAIRITIRVWDRKTQQTRQVTIIQDM